MAEGSSGGVGVLGVLVGALIVIVVGGGLLLATGNLGQKSSNCRRSAPTNKPGSGAFFLR